MYKRLSPLEVGLLTVVVLLVGGLVAYRYLANPAPRSSYDQVTHDQSTQAMNLEVGVAEFYLQIRNQDPHYYQQCSVALDRQYAFPIDLLALSPTRKEQQEHDDFIRFDEPISRLENQLITTKSLYEQQKILEQIRDLRQQHLQVLEARQRAGPITYAISRIHLGDFVSDGKRYDWQHRFPTRVEIVCNHKQEVGTGGQRIVSSAVYRWVGTLTR